MTVPFSTNEKSALERSLTEATKPKANDLNQLIDYYEINETVEWIQRGQFSQVALQFEDALLSDAACVYKILNERLNGKCECFILGDTTFGSCCVDEVAAKHYNADAIVHYGDACLSQTARYPVFYVFGKLPIDESSLDTAVERLLSEVEGQILVAFDVRYHHCMKKKEAERSYSDRIVFSKLALTHETPQDGALFHGRVIPHLVTPAAAAADGTGTAAATSTSTVLFIGDEGPLMLSFVYKYGNHSFYSFSPSSSTLRKESINFNQYLKKRFYSMERARDARFIGLLIGTMSTEGYLDILEQMKKLLTENGKKYYYFLIGKINPYKLANFAEIDLFVLISCPQSVHIHEKKLSQQKQQQEQEQGSQRREDVSELFFQPILIPFEIELALNSNREWSTEYVTDLRQLLPGGCYYVESKATKRESSVSLITGKLQTVGIEKNEEELGEEEEQDTALQRRSDAWALSHAAGYTAADFLQSRTWKGVEQRLGESESTTCVDGRRGIASGYEGESTQEEKPIK